MASRVARRVNELDSRLQINSPMFKLAPPSEYPMQFSRMLAEYLKTRPNKAERFYISQWLQSLNTDTLSMLEKKLSLAVEGGTGAEAALLDMVAVCIAAFSAETNGRKKLKTKKALGDKLMELLMLVGSIELSNRGLIRLVGPTALSSNSSIGYTVTEIGIDAAAQLGAFDQTDRLLTS